MAAEAVVSTIVSKAVETLGSAVFKEFALITGIKKEAERLESLVSRINSVILDAENQYYFNTGNNEQMKDWIKKLKDVMEDIENLLDDINTEALWQKAMGGNNFVKKVRLFFSSSNQFVYGVKMGREIKAVREKLDDISEERSKFNLDISPLTAVQPVLTQRAHETDAHCPHIVIGREEDKEKILEFLLSVNHEEDNVSVISIWGIGGLGKTTLAQHVYNDKNVEREFDGLRFWVCVSENFDVKTIMKNILGMNEETQLDSLTDKLQQKIGGKKYLLVLDDIWNEDINKWHDLKDRLMCGARGSKIIVTTRNSGIANMMSSTHTHELKGLSDFESWDLFAKKVFGSRLTDLSEEQQMVGRDILKKCKGVPLAIQVIGGMLKKTQLSWSNFRDTELSQVTDIMSVLRLSYNHLPPYLKHCFALCSFYLKDHQIDIEELVNLWMANGYIIQKGSSQCMKDVGYEYFDDLLQRSFFQEVEVDNWGDPSTCKMHDLMHGLAKSVSGEGQRLYVLYNNNDQDIVLSRTSFERNKMRTVLLRNQYPFRYKERWVEFISNSRHLRALELGSEYCTADFDISDYVRILKPRHLRYLILKSWSIKTLPNSIARLQNLQILNLNRCTDLQRLPKGITKLVNLMELHLEHCYRLTHIPHGIGKLPVLQVLSKFVVSQQTGSVELIELEGLNKLKGNLEIQILGRVTVPESECRVANLKAKQYLKHLELKWPDHRIWEDDEILVQRDERCLEELQPNGNLKSLSINGYGGITLPNWISTLTNLVNFTISDCRKCRIIPSLDQLSSLKRLCIQDMPKLESIEVSCDSNYLGLKNLISLAIYRIPKWGVLPKGLQCATALEVLHIRQCEEIDISNLTNHNLQKLLIQDIPKLVELPDGLQHASKLQLLLIEGCKNLKGLPSWMSNLTSLNNLYIRDCSNELYERCQNNTATDWPFISHIPNIMIGLQYIKQAGIYR